MPKRIVLLLALLGLGLTAGAVAPWTVQWPNLSSGVERQVRKSFGLDLDVVGRSTVAFLPVPRVKFDGISLKAGDGQVLVSGGQLRGEFRIWPLLWGEFKLTELSLTGSRIDVPLDQEGRGPWDAVLGHVRERLAQGNDEGVHLRRLILADTTIVVTELATSRRAIVDDVDLLANWPSPAAALDLAGSLSWRGETVSFAVGDVVPAAWLAGRPGRIALRASAPAARLQVSGDVTPGTRTRFAGHALFETRSVRDFAGWAGLPVPLGPVLGAVAAEGALTAEGEAASWTLSSPSIRVLFGQDRLDGALMVRSGPGRLAVTGTLAADSLDLSDIAGAAPSRAAPGWSGEAIDLAALSGADLDLRLSAATARIGPLRLGDLAGGVRVTPGRVETTIGRATLASGRIKGRVGLNAAESGVELRLSGGFERVEVGALLAELGQPRWLMGAAAGQFSVEAQGESAADLVRRAAGRGTLTIRGGEIGGVNLADVLRRAESRPLSAFLDWRGGRTAFEQAQQTWTMSAGVADIEGAATGPGLQGVVQGRVSVIERQVALRAKVEGASGRGTSTLVFDLSGPWDDVAVVPDARALIERSGAARPLLPASTQ